MPKGQKTQECSEEIKRNPRTRSSDPCAVFRQITRIAVEEEARCGPLYAIWEEYVLVTETKVLIESTEAGPKTRKYGKL